MSTPSDKFQKKVRKRNQKAKFKEIDQSFTSLLKTRMIQQRSIALREKIRLSKQRFVSDKERISVRDVRKVSSRRTSELKNLCKSLSQFIRLTVYSYLDMKTTIQKLGLLSKREREAVQSSEIARENKILKLNVSPIHWQ